MLNQELILLIDTIRKLYRRQAKQNLIKILLKTHPGDLSLLFRHFTRIERKDLFHLLMEENQELTAQLLPELDESITLELIQETDLKKIALLLELVDADDEADILGALPEDLREKLLRQLEAEESQEVEDLMKYPEDTAGGLMTPDVFALQEDTTAQEAIATLQQPERAEMVFYLYVVDDRNHLVGVLSLRQLITVAPKTKLRHIMSTNVVSVHPETDQEEAARIVSRYNILAVPVVDHENKLLGIVTVDDIIDVIREEATEDFLQMAGVGRDREILLKPPLEAVRLRFPWLLATWIGGLIASIIVGLYKDVLSQVVILAAFMPVIAGMGGNVGSQSSTIITRGLATGRVNVKDLWKLLFREIRIGILLGFLYGILLGLFAFLFYGWNLYLALVTATGIAAAMTLASAMGTVGPIFLSRIGVDPAIATGPFVTTSIDILGLLIYLSIAAVFITNLV
jgi:magnesium transporter